MLYEDMYEKAPGETQTLSQKIFVPPQTPFRGRRTAKI